MKFIKVNGKSYVFKKNITEAEFELFKTHRGRENYYFKISKGKPIRLYVGNNSY